MKSNIPKVFVEKTKRERNKNITSPVKAKKRNFIHIFIMKTKPDMNNKAGKETVNK